MTAFTQPLLVHRRHWVVLLAVWGLGVAWSLQVQLQDLRAHNESVLGESARKLLHLLVLTHSWNASAGPMQALVAEQEQGVQFRLINQQPGEAGNPPDAWEREALQALEAGRSEYMGTLQEPARGAVHRYMAPLRVAAPCLQCHAGQGYRVGELRGGIYISQSYAPLERADAPSRQHAYALHGALFLLVALCGAWLLEQLRRRRTEAMQARTELQATQDHLLQTERMASLGRMVAGFSHEINTPIGVAVGALSNSEGTIAQMEALLVGDEISEDTLRTALASLREADQLASANLQRAARLVQAFKRTAIDQTADETRVFDLAQLNRDILAALHNPFKRTSIALNLDCPEHLRVNGRPGLIEQVLTNLLLNSLTHGFEDGRRAGSIHIQWRTAPGRLCLSFSDDGQGMTEEARRQVFEPFFTTRRDQGGSGLGLYICHTIIHARLHGSIVCQSAPGQGTRFTLEFPAEIRAP